MGQWLNKTVWHQGLYSTVGLVLFLQPRRERNALLDPEKVGFESEYSEIHWQIRFRLALREGEEEATWLIVYINSFVPKFMAMSWITRQCTLPYLVVKDGKYCCCEPSSLKSPLGKGIGVWLSKDFVYDVLWRAVTNPRWGLNVEDEKKFFPVLYISGSFES